MTIKDQTRYSEAVGRRKTAVARVRVQSGAGKAFIINDKPIAEYFKTEEERHLILDPIVKGLGKGKVDVKWNVEVHVLGGGAHSQAEAIRHGLSRALVVYNPELRKDLKTLGYLKRDPRAKERRKFGLKKARKAPQWSKR